MKYAKKQTSVRVKGGAYVRVVLPEPVSATTIVTPNRSTQYKSSSPVKGGQNKVLYAELKVKRILRVVKYSPSPRRTVFENGKSLPLSLHTELSDANGCRR